MLFNIPTIFTTAVLGLATQAAAAPHHSSSMHRRGNGTNPWTISSFPTTDCSQTANNTQAAIGQVGCSGICNPLSSTFFSIQPQIVYGTWELELFTDMLCEVPATDYIVDAESTACGPVSLGGEGSGSFRMVLLGGLNDITCD